ncbi:MAG: hypothetical protein JNL82_04630 [Myxococcales bacterium]|nr:hypothetical protein [Myxococcales bacterium]
MLRRTTAPPRATWGPSAAGGGRGARVGSGRRGFLGLAAASPLLLAAGGELEAVRPRKARFEEVGDSVLMTVALPELLAPDDQAAMASLDAAFATTLTYEIAVWRARAGEPLGRRRVLVRIQWDAWKERYAVVVEEPGRATSTRHFGERDAAIAAATTLERLRVADAASLERGPEATYYATVIGRRNPVDRGLRSRPAGDGAGDSTFARWIGMFVRGEQRAERTVALRTSPAFYLVTR